VRKSDLVARLGGDEFAIIQLGSDSQPAAAHLLAERLVRELGRPFEVGEHRIRVGASVGVALAPEDGTEPDDLLQKADLALYDAKMDGRSTFSFFRPEMHEAAQLRRLMERDLRHAEVNGELELHYQPMVSLQTQAVLGFEALLRWRHPVRGLVMPDDFIGLAEETGLIEPLGEWVVRRAFADAVRWPGSLGVAVNLSAVQVRNDALTGMVTDALEETGLAPERVELEITESALQSENPGNLATLHGLHAKGVRICLDDFGAGYSSLSYLRSFPFTKIKIDRSFVRDLATKRETAAIMRAITALCRSMDMSVSAEGVETHDEFQQVQRLGCDEAQGYLIGRPKPRGDLEAFLQKNSGRRDWIRTNDPHHVKVVL
jgi:predicted signal transduction protein with EAL and GGDEF domain